jgi:radical SAM protein with 4Fe4S-binding SPASM domain
MCMKNRRNLFNLLSKLTFRRAWNALLVLSSYHLSRLTGKPLHSGMPIAVSIEPTTSCNLRCPECPSGLRSFTRPTGMLSESLFQQTLDQLSPTLLYLTFYFQGEPYLHPRFLEMVSYAAKRKIYTATSTNAHYLSDELARKTVESGLDKLIISLDGTTQETYQAYRIGGKLEKVIAGTRKVLEWKRKLGSVTPHLVFQFLVVRPNEHQIEEVYQLAAELGIDEVQLKTAQVYGYEQGSPLIPTLDKYSRYRLRPDGRYEIKNQLLNHCWRMWHSCVITQDGGVVPCCFDKDAQYRLGDVSTTPFRTLWKQATYQEFRKLLLKGRDQVQICRNCTEGTHA